MLESAAERLGSKLLWASSVRARIIVLSEYKGQLGEALNLANQAIAHLSGEVRSPFLIQEVVGRELVYAKRWSEALTWLDEALGWETDAFAFMRMQLLLTASQAASNTDVSKAIQYCERAVVLAETSEHIPNLQVVVALGEKAIAHWCAGDRVATYTCWDAAVERLLAAKSEDERWKKLFVICGHVSGYFVSVAHLGKPPQTDFEYKAPEPGMFLADYPAVICLYDPSRDWLIVAQLAMFAEAVGRDEDAARWALRAVEAGRGGYQEGISGALRLFAVGQAIIEDRYRDALEIAVDTSVTLSAEFAKQVSKQAAPQSQAGTKLKPGEDQLEAPREQGEKHAAIMALIPIIFRMATRWLSDPEGVREDAANVADICIELANSSKSPDLWNSSGKLLNEIFATDASWLELSDRGNEFAAKGQTILHIICYMGAMMHSLPKHALKTQLAILPTLEAYLSHYGIFRRIVVPFVHAYWQNSLERSPFYFSAPGLLRDRLLGLAGVPPEAALKRSLREIRFSLGISPDEESTQWLNST